MAKKIAIVAITALLVTNSALAVWNAQDDVPAASLLVPYAFVAAGPDNTTDPNGYSTLFAITNTASEAILVQVTLWDCEGNLVVNWNIALTGYDVWTVNFRDVLNGDFDLFDTQAPTNFELRPESPEYSWTPEAWGPLYPNPPNRSYQHLHKSEQWPDNPAECKMPYGKQTIFSEIIRTKLRWAQLPRHNQIFPCIYDEDINNYTWSGELNSLSPFFFFVTADVVKRCNRRFQTEADYWSPPTHQSTNVLIGDVIYVNDTKGTSEMINAIPLEAGGDPAIDTNFYELLLDEIPGVKNLVAEKDNREPLGSQYAFRYATLPSPLQSEIIVWKNRSEITNNDNTVFGCRPYSYYTWNEDEFTKSHWPFESTGPVTIAEPNVLPFMTQLVPVNRENFPGLVTIGTQGGLGGAGWGWMWLNFDGGDLAGTPEGLYEAWVGVRFDAGQRSSDAERAMLMYTPYNRNKLVSVAGNGQ